MLQIFCSASGRTDNNWSGFTVYWYNVIPSTFFWTNLNWENLFNCISCFHLMAVVYLIINRRPTVSFALLSDWHFHWSMAVALGAALVNAGGRGIRAIFVYQQENKCLHCKNGGLFWSCHMEVYTLGARIYKDISVRPDSWQTSLSGR